MADLYVALDKLEQYRRNLGTPYTNAVDALRKARGIGLPADSFGHLPQSAQVAQSWSTGAKARAEDAEKLVSTLITVMDALSQLIDDFTVTDKDSGDDIRRSIPEGP